MSELIKHVKFNIKQPKILVKDFYFNLVAQVEKHINNFMKTVDELGIDFTFFFSGKCVERNPERIKSLSDRYEICTHGYEHTSYDLLKEPKKDLMRSIEVLEEIGVKPLGFRPPSLWNDERARSLDIYKMASECGIKYISSRTDKERFTKHGVAELPIIGEDWDLVYRKNLRSSDKISEIWLEKIRNGGVFVFHSHLTGREPYLSAFSDFVKRSEHEFVFSKDLLKKDGVSLTCDISAFSRRELIERILNV